MSRDRDCLLSVRDLIVRYPARSGSRLPLTAVRGVSLDIPKSGIFGLVGESGSGKSTLAHAIAGLTPAAGGKILFRGEELNGAVSRRKETERRNIQLVFQDALASLSPRRSILKTLLEPLDHFRLGDPPSRVGKAVSMLRNVGLDTALRHRYPHEISGGQRQRVALARALVASPDLVIADEPLSSLDVPAQLQMIDLILKLRDSLGVAFLFVSHDLSSVRRLADTVGVMYVGKMVEYGSKNILFSQPAHPYTRALMAAIPIADPGHPRPAVLAGEPPSPLTPPAGCVFHMRCPDKITVCSSVEPGEFAIDTQGGMLEGNQELKSAGHRVRCHLCNTRNC